MLLVATRRWTLSSFLSVVASLLVAQASLAQQPENARPSSKIIEVSEYLSQSDATLACDPRTAETLARKALDTVSAARDTDPVLIDALGELKAQSNLKIINS